MRILHDEKKQKRPPCGEGSFFKKQAEMARLWDQRLRDPLAFVPKEERIRNLTPTEARENNTAFGKFAASYLKKILTRTTHASDRVRRLANERKIMAVGYGYGYDYFRFLRNTARVGLQTVCVDVSLVASMWATTNLRAQFSTMQLLQPTPCLEPLIIESEIQSLLAEPEVTGLDLDSIEVWYLCRLLNCISTASAKAVLQEIGWRTLSSRNNSSKRGAVVIINALLDQNPIDDECTGTSIRRSKRMILANLRYGADCPVETRYVEYYQYFGRLVTAMTVMAKR